MPILTLKTAPLIDTAARAPLARALTGITHHTLGKRRDVTAVVIEDLPAAGWAELQRQLGGSSGLEPASYIVVRELPAGDWGWGGRTQAARLAGRAAVPA
jgi:4-oxalocrotonate tautomerase